MRGLPTAGAVLVVCVALGLIAPPGLAAAPPSPSAYVPEPGRPGHRLVVALRSEPKTLNPLVAVDVASKEVLASLMGDLVHINRFTQRSEPGLAASWKVSSDGRRYTLRLRPGLRFSDGHPVDADDVVFSFELYLDEKLQAPQRGLLVVGGKPIAVRKLDAATVAFELASPYAAAERLFDGFAILPRHLLEKAYRERRPTSAWGLSTSPSEVAGLGPFRLREYVAGQRLVVERNPHFWKVDTAGRRLPYLDEVVFLFVASEDAQVLRFESGETDLITRLSAENFSALEKDQASRGFQLQDLGPGLDYSFLVFNLDPQGRGPGASSFRKLAFRRAVSDAVDRDAIVRLAFAGRATPLVGHVTPGNELWVNSTLVRRPRSPERAREELRSAGFSWSEDGALHDGQTRLQFSLLVNAANAPRVKMATLLQDDLKSLGIEVQVVPLENRALLNRVLETRDFEAALMALGGGDADPNGEMNVWLSSGATHLWQLGETHPATDWEAEIDRLMREQMVALQYAQRKKLYDRVQELVAKNLPVICLVAPNVLVGAKQTLGNFRPARLEPQALWNVDELFWRDAPGARP